MEELIKQLIQMNLKPNDNILIHSSVKKINRDPDLVIKTLINYFDEGMVLLPTHTWAQMNKENNRFNPKKEPSCVGLLTEKFRNYPGVLRSLQPTHSMAGYGKNVKEFIDLDLKSNTPGSPLGTWGNLDTIDAKILLIGCDMTRNTYVHAIEEVLNIPDRLTKEPITFELVTDEGIIKKDFYKHYSSTTAHLSMHYKKTEQRLIELGIITKHKFGDADVLMMNAKDLKKQIIKWLEVDPHLFDYDGEMPKYLFDIIA
ncbi:AAC(3) family N-acetyltransferase [Acholeplasma granularum]|uniref:AAC(3) family N-acetyltransferase n=1 Tax=Acholeplasma granularum TaxID=264635 RepID=UPI00046E9164|nr:AAC(3) family N-acetyltransferase [Acholeplasma granularum]